MVNEIEVINMGKTFVLGAVAIGSIGAGLIYLASRFNFPHELPDDKIKTVIDDCLNPVAALGQMGRLYQSSGSQHFQDAEKAPVNSRIEYIELKYIHRCNLDLNHLPLSRLEKIVAKAGKSVAKPCQLATGEFRAEPYDTLEEIKQKGSELGAVAFSFQDAQMIHGDYVFNVLYHKSIN